MDVLCCKWNTTNICCFGLIFFEKSTSTDLKTRLASLAIVSVILRISNYCFWVCKGCSLTPEIFFPEIEIWPNMVFFDKVLEVVRMSTFNFTRDEWSFFQNQLGTNVVGTAIGFGVKIWVKFNIYYYNVIIVKFTRCSNSSRSDKR